MKKNKKKIKRNFTVTSLNFEYRNSLNFKTEFTEPHKNFTESYPRLVISHIPYLVSPLNFTKIIIYH